MKKRTILALLLAVMMIVFMILPGCAKKNDGIVIGFAGPTTGASAQDGQNGLQGLVVAVELKNAAGGINGKQISINQQDDKGDPKEAAIVANKLAEDKSVLAIVGHYNSSCTLAGAPIYNAAKVVSIAFGSSSPAVTDAGPYTYRTIPTDDIGGRYSAKWAFEKYGAKTVAIVHEDTDYGNGVVPVYEEECAAAGVQIVATEKYLPGETTDFTTMVTKIKDANPDIILLGTLYNETALFCKQAKQIGYSVPMIGVDALYSPGLTDLGGDAVEGITFSAFFSVSNPDPKVVEFVKAYREKYNEDPGTYAAYAYDAAQLIFAAIENGGEDRVKINDYLTNVSSFPGVTGNNGFDSNGDVAYKDPVMVTVKNGQFEVIS